MKKNKKRRAYYERVRLLRQAIAEKNNALALESEDFRKGILKKEYLKRAICQPEIWEDVKLADEYRAEIEKVDAKLEGVLQSLKLSWADLTVQCRCKKCLDTGYVSDGECDCYPGDDWE